MNDQLPRPSRRQLLGMLGGVGALVIAGCGDDGGTSAPETSPSTTSLSAGGTSTTSTATSTTGASAPATTALVNCAPIAQETAGPFPADGTNGPNVLTQAGVTRRDIRSGFGASTKVAEGLPLTVTLTIVDKAGCKPLPGATVYLWQCDINGAYSLYSQGVTADNYLRGVQVADANGQLSFLTVFPGAYVGRWPHIHFEVFANAASATSGRNARATSQLALPEDVCRLVYATPAYAASLRGLGQSTLQSDNVFRDGWTTQMPTLTGNTTAGYEAKLSVAV